MGSMHVNSLTTHVSEDQSWSLQTAFLLKRAKSRVNHLGFVRALSKGYRSNNINVQTPVRSNHPQIVTVKSCWKDSQLKRKSVPRRASLHSSCQSIYLVDPDLALIITGESFLFREVSLSLSSVTIDQSWQPLVEVGIEFSSGSQHAIMRPGVPFLLQIIRLVRRKFYVFPSVHFSLHRSERVAYPSALSCQDSGDFRVHVIHVRCVSVFEVPDRPFWRLALVVGHLFRTVDEAFAPHL